jgi:hypothetical protein
MHRNCIAARGSGEALFADLFLLIPWCHMPDSGVIQPRRHRRVVRHKLPLTAHLDAEVVAELRGRQTMLGGSLSAVINQLLLIEALRAGVEHGARLEQIQLSLGHASIRTTERYLVVEQDLTDAPCDRLGLRLS